MSYLTDFPDEDSTNESVSTQEGPPRNRFLVGCLGCLGVLVCAVLLLCAGGYYVVWHTSVPLGMVESMLESSGDVEIEGLSGTVSSGFHIDEARFGTATEAQKPSIFKNVEFRFNGIRDLFQEERRLIIEEFSIESAAVYLTLEEETNTEETNLPDTSDRNPEVHTKGGSGESLFKEVRIDLIQVTDLKIINSRSGSQSAIGKFSMKDFHYLDGEFKNVGEYEIDGLTILGQDFELHNFAGSPSSGFHIDRVRGRNDKDQWSSVEKIVFEFNGAADLLKNKRLLIDRIAAESGTFYVQPNLWTSSYKFPVESETGDPDAAGGERLKEFSITEIELPNMKIINAETEVELTIKEIRLMDFQCMGQQITKLGSIDISADHLTFHSQPSTEFSDQPKDLLRRRFSGVLEAGLHEQIVQDIAFKMDCCFTRDGQVLSDLTMLDGRFKQEVRGSRSTIRWNDLTLTDFIAWNAGLIPSNITGNWVVEQNTENEAGDTLRFSTDTTIQLGNNKFRITETDFIADRKLNHSPAVPFRAATKDGDLVCRLYSLRNSPFVAIELDGKEKNSKELFAKIFFDSAFSDLTKSQQSQIAQNQQAVKQLSAPVESNAEKPSKSQ